MSRLQVRGDLPERWEEVRERLIAAYDQFRESRLYVQVVCTAVLVAAAALIHRLPVGPLAQVDQAITWVVTGDYDFADQGRRANQWAQERGGWLAAASGLWDQGLSRVQGWFEATPAPAPQQPVQAEPEPLLPVDGAVLFAFGWLPPGVGDRFHEGIDFVVKAGDPVMAVLDGTVIAVRTDQKLGRLLEIRHGEMVATYAQVEGIKVRTGDAVKRGQVVAAVARSSGVEESLSPHLHFEIRPAATGQPVDPASFLGLGGKQL